MNPAGLVPTFMMGEGTVLTQSLAIIDYIEAMHPAPLLLPSDPLKRAHVLELVNTVACDTHPLQNLRVLQSYPEAERPERAKQVITEGLQVFETLLRQSGRYCVGDKVTLADVVLVPQVYNAVRWGVDMTAFPKIGAIMERLRMMPAFVAAHPDSQPDSPNHQQ